MDLRAPLVVRLYGLASLILPARFRRARGAAMQAMFEEEWRERSGWRRLTLLAGALLDLLRTAVLERIDRRRALSGSGRRRGWVFSWLDLRLGVRMLRKQPLLTAVSVVSLALGIPAGLAPGHIIDALEDPRAVQEDERVRLLRYRSTESFGRVLPTTFDLEAWRASLRSVEAVGGTRLVEYNFDAGASGGSVVAAEVSGGMFGVLGVEPLLGRTLAERDAAPGAPPVVVLGEDLWRTRLDGDPAVLGRTVRVGGEPHTVVGIMPASFGFPVRQQVWLPLRERSADEPGVGTRLEVYGRLAEGATQETVRTEIDLLRGRLALEHPEAYERLTAEVVPTSVAARLGSGDGRVRGSYFLPLSGVMGSPLTTRSLALLPGLMLLLLTCVNVALLIFARAATRSSELAVRTALGATRTRIVGQVFAEALVLAMLSAGVGLVLLHVLGTRYYETIRSTLGAHLPLGFGLGVTWRTALRALVLAALSAAAAAVVPALRVTGKTVARNIQRSGASGLRFGWLSTALVAADVAFAVAAVAVAAGVSHRMGPALAGAFQHELTAEEYLVARVRLPVTMEAFETGTEEVSRALRMATLEQTLVGRLRVDPQVRGVALASALPGMDHARRNVEISEGTHAIDRGQVAPGFFDGLGRPLLAGRDFGPADLEGERRAVIVNEAFVQNVLEGGSAIGRELRYPSEGESARWYEIVGVAPDLGMDPLNPSGGAGVYHPVAPGELGSPWLAVHVGPNAMSYAPRLRELVAQADPGAILEYPMTLADAGLGDDRLILLGMVTGSVFLSALLLALAASSIYAIMAFTVAQRTREIGVRTALGAQPSDIVATVGRRAGLQIGIGVLAGMPLAGRLFYLTQEDPGTGWAAVAAGAVLPGIGVLLLLAAVACAAPLARALRVLPTVAMRAE